MRFGAHRHRRIGQWSDSRHSERNGIAGRQLTPEIIPAGANKAAEQTDPDDDSYASAAYKRHMATIYALRAIEAAVRRSAG